MGVLDTIAGGVRAEAALTAWARGARYAGSGDRAAVRDHVFDALRRRRSLAALGGGADGRGLMLGALRNAGTDPDALFTGGHAPAPLTAAERAHLSRPAPMSEAEALDIPDWLAPALRDSLGDRFAPVMAAMRHRAPVYLRVNLARIPRNDAMARLAAEGIATRPGPLADTALEVTANARRIQHSATYAQGLVELQDAASQAVVAVLPVTPGMRVLDICAGGGGKALALAARGAAVSAHDADPRRMADLPRRAARAGVRIPLLADPAAAGPQDLVLADVPCSGSGSWRRDPEGKWRLTPDRLQALLATQAAILDRAAGLVRPGGSLAHATCSLLRAENVDQSRGFLARHPSWRLMWDRDWTPLEGGDGFHLALLTRDPT